MILPSPVAGIASAALAAGRPLSQSATVPAGLGQQEWAALVWPCPRGGDDSLPGGSQEVVGPESSPRNPKRLCGEVREGCGLSKASPALLLLPLL